MEKTLLGTIILKVLIRIDNIEVNGQKTERLGEVSEKSSSPTDHSIRVRSPTSSSMVRVESHTLTLTFTRVNGKMAKLTETVASLTKTAPCTTVTGLMINSMVLVLRSGTQVKLSILETSMTVKRPELVNSSSRVATTRVISSMENSRAKANTTSLRAERSMRESSWITP